MKTVNRLANIQIITIFFITLGYPLQTNPMLPVITKDNVKDYNLNIDQRIQDHKNGKIYIQIGKSKLKIQTSIYENLNIYFWNQRKYIASTVFEELAEKNRPDLIKKIIDCDPQAVSDEEFLQTFDNILLFKDSVELAKVFINAIDINQEFGQVTPLSEAKATPLVKLLLIHNANPNRIIVEDMTPLSLSFGLGDTMEKLQLLVIGGGDITIDSNAREKLLNNKDVRETCEKRNALFKAVQTAKDLQKLRSFQLPLKYVRDTKGNSLLYHALRNENYIIAKTLFCLWPRLLIQHNFAGKAALNTLPRQSITCLSTNYN